MIDCNKSLKKFEKIARNSPKFGELRKTDRSPETHPFDERNIHPDISSASKKLFDDGHYSQSVFEAYKHIDKLVAKLARNRKGTGFSLMMDALNEKTPKIKLTDLSTVSEIDEQLGFKFIFSGSISAIRNPRGHEVGNLDDIEQCLDYLGLASMLLRRLDKRLEPR